MILGRQLCVILRFWSARTEAGRGLGSSSFQSTFVICWPCLGLARLETSALAIF